MSEEATVVQQKPRPGKGPAIWDLVIIDVRARLGRGEEGVLVEKIVADGLARDEMGAKKYGQRLQADDGRDHLVDAYQEALDLAVYLRQEIAECWTGGLELERLTSAGKLYRNAIDLVFDLAEAIRARKA